MPDESPSNITTESGGKFIKSVSGPSYGALPVEVAQPAYTAPAPIFEG